VKTISAMFFTSHQKKKKAFYPYGRSLKQLATEEKQFWVKNYRKIKTQSVRCLRGDSKGVSLTKNEWSPKDVPREISIK